MKLERKNYYLGRKNYIDVGTDMGDEYYSLAQNDEKAAALLESKHLFNQACYFYIQSMEKYIKAAICRKIDITNPYYASKIRNLGHSVDKAVDLYLEIITAGKDEVLAEMLRNQLKIGVLKNIKFGGVHNSVRYPTYLEKNKKYFVTKMNCSDCAILGNILNVLKNYIQDLECI